MDAAKKAMTVVLAALFAAGLAGCIGGPAAKPKGKAVVRVNCAADSDYVDQTGAKWLADQLQQGEATWGAIGGMTITREGLTISDTDAPDVYLNERYSMDGYSFSLPNGRYTVRLHFAETFDGITAEAQRIFSVKINGKVMLKDFDPFKEAGGFAKPVVEQFKGVEVTDGKLTIEFVAGVQNPEINGIEIFEEP